MYYFLLIIIIVQISSFPIADDQVYFPDDERLRDSADDLKFDHLKFQNDPDILRSGNTTSDFTDDEDIDDDHDYENGEFFQGDIDLEADQLDILNNTDSHEDDVLGTRTGLLSEQYRWPKNKKGKVIVPYVLSKIYSSARSERIKKAMQNIEMHTCIKFQSRYRQKDYISIESGNGCHSKLGKIGGRQVVSLKIRGCFKHGTIIHELVHALGYTHMHNHKDRDKYVTIYWDNIQKERFNNFKKVNTNEFGNFGTAYDYKSVMHYGSKAFSKNQKRTMVPRLKYFRNVIGQRVGLSIGDALRINNMYECRT